MTAPAVRLGAPVVPDRPAGVSVATFLLSGAAAFWLAAAIATLFAIPQYARHVQDVEQNPDAGTGATVLLALFAFVAVSGAVIAILLAVFDAHGRTTARILTWVYAGLTVCVATVILLADPFTGVLWHHWLSLGVAVLTLALTVAVTVLLALPVATRYYRT
ncbi:MAG: hypothetical protein WCA46_14355, partial [Actinocatenispora sp.]